MPDEKSKVSVESVRDFLQGPVALFLAYGVDLMVISMFMWNIAPQDLTMAAYFTIGFLVVTYKLQAASFGWIPVWAVAAALNAYTGTSFFVATAAPDTERPKPEYLVQAIEDKTRKESAYNLFMTNKQDAIDKNRLTLLRDTLTPKAELESKTALDGAISALNNAQAMFGGSRATALEVFGRIPKLLEHPDAAKVTLLVFSAGTSSFLEFVLFYAVGGRFKKGLRLPKSKDKPVPKEDKGAYPFDKRGKPLLPVQAAAILKISLDEAVAMRQAIDTKLQ
jgi:hypothetical protein